MSWNATSMEEGVRLDSRNPVDEYFVNLVIGLWYIGCQNGAVIENLRCYTANRVEYRDRFSI